jgi:T5SS/PEP-CTERM-associated repeat protein
MGTLEMSDGQVNAARLSIGTNDTGEGTVSLTGATASVTVEPSSALPESGDVIVGDSGKGTLTVDGAGLTSDSGIIARSLFSAGDVTVGGASGFGVWNVTAADLVVGQFGAATLDITNGNRVDIQAGNLIIAPNSESTGTVFVSGANSSGLPNLSAIVIDVGETGDLLVGAGALVRSVSTENKQLLGLNVAGGFTIQAEGICVIDGDVTLAGASFAFPNPSPPDATIDMEENAELHAAKITIGDEAGTAGGIFSGSVGAPVLVGLPNVNVEDQIVVRDTGILKSSVSVDGSVTVQGGTVEVILQIPGLEQDVSPGGLISINGDLVVDTGTIKVDAAGFIDGEYGVITVTGTADVANATLHLNFVDGFLPLTGDQIPFLEATGGATISDLSFEYSGVADGFDFTVTEQSGMLVFEALNDALPTDPPGTDIDGNFTMDAVDVQLVINAVLGLPIDFNADVDASGTTDAVDVQLVISADLGV